MTDLSLSSSTADGRARAKALDESLRPEVTPTSLVTFMSHGRVLIVGDESAALAAADRLGEGLVPTLFVPSASLPATDTVDGLAVVRGGLPQLAGSLGNFTLSFSPTDADEEPPVVAILSRARFDLVLDLTDPPLLSHEVPPLGYYAPRGDPEALDRAIETLPEMRGEFEKPKFFNYDADICAHGRSGIPGCTRCLDACPTLAITSLAERVSVDPNLCQGAGNCASVCPTGAITYAFPTGSDLLAHLRGVLATFREAGGADPVLVFFDNASAAAMEAEIAATLPENALPIEVEEVGSVGMDAWLACLAYGAGHVMVLTGPATPPRTVKAIEPQTHVLTAIMEGMGYPGALVTVQASDDAAAVNEATRFAAIARLQRPARFAAPNEKRTLLRMVLEHLFEQAPTRQELVALPEGAPFGQIIVDRTACTLCMSCVSVCPTSALRGGQGLPQLKFMEWACVQCGLCERACPEDAISLQPRLLFDDEQRSAPRLLHEEPPFCCVSCGKPFATRSMLAVMMRKLEGHWMFQTDEARRRLEMCEDCRVKDLIRAQGGGPMRPD